MFNEVDSSNRGMTIQERLFTLQDTAYRDFISGLIPTLAKESIIGVRTPALKMLARQLEQFDKDAVDRFVCDLPHDYYDENRLQAIFIDKKANFTESLQAIHAFLPYVDNWAVCDSLNPSSLAQDKVTLKKAIDGWLNSAHEYTIRFAIGMLMKHFLVHDFEPFCLDMVASIRSEAYYVNMMVAWFFATGLTKRYQDTLPYLLDQRLPIWNHNKALQKAIESDQIDTATKAYLRKLKIGKIR